MVEDAPVSKMTVREAREMLDENLPTEEQARALDAYGFTKAQLRDVSGSRADEILGKLKDLKAEDVKKVVRTQGVRLDELDKLPERIAGGSLKKVVPPSDAQAYHLNRFSVPEDHMLRSDPGARSEWIGFLKEAESQNKAGNADGLRRKMTEINEQIAKAADGPEKDFLKAKRNVIEDIVGPGPAGSIKDVERAREKMSDLTGKTRDELKSIVGKGRDAPGYEEAMSELSRRIDSERKSKAKDKVIDVKEADVSATEKPAKKTVGSETKAPAPSKKLKAYTRSELDAKSPAQLYKIAKDRGLDADEMSPAQIKRQLAPDQSMDDFKKSVSERSEELSKKKK